MIFMGKQFSQEETNLYNPAYVGVLLYQSIREYENKNDKSGMHCGLVYLIAPLSLYKMYTDILPQRTSITISSWATQHEGELSGFPYTVNAYADIVNSAIAFLMQREVLSLDEEGVFHVVNNSFLKGKLPDIRNDTKFHNSYLSAGLLGRWFAGNTPQGVYVQLGIRP